MNPVRKLYSTLRWRLIPVRYAGKMVRQLTARSVPARMASGAANDTGYASCSDEMHRCGFASGPTIPAPDLAAMQDIYGSRSKAVVPKVGGHPFTNLFREDDLSADNPVFRFALSPAVLDAAHAYFDGRFQFDSIQVLYSWPTDGDLLESQLWHKDYGDSSAFHCVAYLNDVVTPEDGPFVFVDRQDSARIRSSIFIRRIDDSTFAQELSGGEVRSFLAPAGHSVLVDPSVCYHYGSRCRRPRLAIFATFSTDKPYVGAQPLIRRNARRAASAAKLVRPDLAAAYLDRLFGA